MNPNRKDNSGWILCPSKSFPGKLYYFNVHNGETAWSLNDADKKAAKRVNVEKITDKTHNYPEPASPPIDCQTPTASQVNSNYPQTSFINTPQPMFGQTVFPKYISTPNSYMQNIIWMPIQLPTPMFVANAPHKSTTDQITQTFSQESELSVQACNLPLSKRFKNFEGPLITFNKDNRVVNINRDFTKPTSNNQLFGPTTVQTFDRSKVTFLRPSKNLIPARTRTKSDSETIDESSNMLRLEREQRKVGEISTVSQDHKVDNVRRKSLDMNALDSTDLRFLLVAKRMKNVNCDEIPNEIEGKNSKSNYTYSDDDDDDDDDDKEKIIPKKRVSFNLKTDDSSDDISECDASCGFNPYKEERNTLKCLRELSNSSRQAIWYIAVDTEMILKELAFIERFVRLDSNCRILIPYVVAANVRRDILTAPQTYLHVQNLETEESARNMSPQDRIINCCLKMSELNYHVVLITNDSKLYNKARSLHVHCYKLDEIKHNRPETAKKIHITIDNARENLFLKSANDFDPFPLSKKVDITASRQRLFDKTSVAIKNSNLNVDEKYINRPNKNVAPDYESDATGTTTEIGRGIQRILIKPVDEEANKLNNIKKKPFEILNTKFQSPFSNRQDHKEISPSRIQCSIQNRANQNELSSEQRHIGIKKKQTFEIQNQFEKPNGSDHAGIKNQTSREKQTFEIQNRYAKQNEFDIQNATVCEKEKSIDIRKENGYKNQPVFDDGLKSFQVTNKEMEDTIKFKIEEWFCSFSQVMEDALSSVLQRFLKSNSVPLCPPWSLQEAAVCIKEVYHDQNVKAAVDKLIILLQNNSCEKGKLNTKIKPNEFMRIIGCSVVLLRYLQVLQSDSETLTEAEQLLISMIRNIKEPLPQNQNELLRCSVPSQSMDEDTAAPRQYFVKHPSDIRKYLEKHFDEWKNCDNGNENDTTHTTHIYDDAKILRTCGRNLKNVTIDKTKAMSLTQPAVDNLKKEPVKNGDGDNATDKIDNDEKGAIDNLQVIDIIVDNDCCKSLFVEPKINRTLQISDSNVNKILNRNIHDDIINNPIHNNTFTVKNYGPNVIRNIKIIDDFEEKFLAQSKLEVPTSTTVKSSINDNSNNINDNITNGYNNNDFAQINDINIVNNVNIARSNDKIARNNDKIAMINDNIVINNHFCAKNDPEIYGDDCTNDSGFENDSLQAYSFLKLFLTELSGSLKTIYKFIDDSITEFKDDDNIEDDRKRRLHDKATLTHYELANIIDKLKCIIQRETKENSELKELLIKAGLRASTDKRMTGYRQVVALGLQQAQSLERALRAMLSAIGHSTSSDAERSICGSTDYYNVSD